MQLGQKLQRHKKLAIALVASLVVGAVLTVALVFTVGRHGLHTSALPADPDYPDDPPDSAPTDTPPASKFPAPVALNGTRPYNVKYRTLDPSMIRRESDGKLFLFTTGGGKGKVWTADSLYGPWKLSSEPMLSAQGGGPDVHNFNGKYYMFHNSHVFDYTTHGVDNTEATYHWHDASILVRSSDTMEHGNWTEHGRLDIPWAAKYNVLDPSIVHANVTGEGMRFLLSFGSYYTGIYQVPLASPPTKLADSAMSHITHLERNTTVTGGPVDRTEASFQWKRDDWYYLFFSSGRCCPEDDGDWSNTRVNPYRVMVCRSRHPRTGFVDKEGRSCETANGGTEVLSSHGEVFAPGGQGIMEDAEVDGTLIYYHYVPFNTTENVIDEGYRFGWNKLNWTTQGWPEVVAL